MARGYLPVGGVSGGVEKQLICRHGFEADDATDFGPLYLYRGVGASTS